MWAVGIYDLHLQDDQFWRLTLRDFSFLMKRHEAHQERLDFRAALVCSVIANVNRGKNQKAFNPKDFMPKKKKVQTPQEMLEHVKVLHKALGGE